VDSTLQITPSDTYEFQCLDTAKEIKNRIRLMIREWNTDADFVEGGDPDAGGAEGSFPAEPNNDYLDWNDFGDTYPASNL
jgi:hypothetical protein